MAIGARYQPEYRKNIKIEETTDQRKRYAKIANKAEKRRRLKNLLIQKKEQLKKPEFKNKKDRILISCFMFFILFFLFLFMKF